jgi:uncharacterized protein YndB with AHSA1/START domain
MSRKPTGKVQRTERGADLIIKRSFRASIEDVWESATASESTARWICSWEGTPGTGNTIQLKMLFEEGQPVSDSRIERCEPPRHLTLSVVDGFGNWLIELNLHQDGDTTELVFVHHLTDPAHSGSTGPGWEYYLDRLVAARSGEPMPDFADYYPAQKEHYTAP